MLCMALWLLERSQTEMPSSSTTRAFQEGWGERHSPRRRCLDQVGRREEFLSDVFGCGPICRECAWRACPTPQCSRAVDAGTWRLQKVPAGNAPRSVSMGEITAFSVKPFGRVEPLARRLDARHK